MNIKLVRLLISTSELKIHINMVEPRTPAIDRKPEASKLIEKSARGIAKIARMEAFSLAKSEYKKIGRPQDLRHLV